MIQKGFGTLDVAMATKHLLSRLLLIFSHKCAKFYLILTSNV